MVNSYTEWGTLKEVILGSAVNAQIPIIKGYDIHCVDYANYDSIGHLPAGKYPEKIISEMEEDLESFQKVLEDLGIKVFRPTPFNLQHINSTPYWASDSYYNYCPRDSAIVIGNTIIETPMALRSRQFETVGLRDIFNEYFLQGSKWVSAPKPLLRDESYDRTNLSKPTLTEIEPIFDAANCVKCGKDIFYLVSNSGNKLGAKWLQSVLGDQYNIHVLDNIYAYVHIDTTIMPLAPGRVLLNPDRINDKNLPKYFASWDKIYAAPPVETEFIKDYAPASPWLSMNLLSISKDTVIVEARQTKLIKQLEQNKFTVIPIRMRHCRTFSGGPHCVTLDTVREDFFEDYK